MSESEIAQGPIAQETNDGVPVQAEEDQVESAKERPPLESEANSSSLDEFIRNANEILGSDRIDLREKNRKQLGQVTLHYASRDVQLLIDGDSAMRLLTMFRERKEGRWSDPLHPFISNAESGWIVLNLEEPLAISYLPVAPKPKLTALDPAVFARERPKASL